MTADLTGVCRTEPRCMTTVTLSTDIKKQLRWQRGWKPINEKWLFISGSLFLHQKKNVFQAPPLGCANAPQGPRCETMVQELVQSLAVSQSEGSMLNGCPFKDAMSQNADKHCSNVENTWKFVPFSRPLFLKIPRFFKGASMDPQRAKIPTSNLQSASGKQDTLLYTSEVFESFHNIFQQRR